MAKPSNVHALGRKADYIRMLIAAGPGFGKTIFAGTAGAKAIFLTTDPEGTISAQRMGSKAEEWEIKSWSDLNEAYVWLKKEGHKEFDWALLDNITEAQLMARTESMNKARDKNAARDEFVPGLDDHQRSQNMTVDLVKRFNDLPMHILYTSHLTDEEDAEGNSYFSIAVHGQKGALARQIQGYMNIVGFGETLQDDDGNDVRRIWFSHHGSYRGKDRFQVLGKARDNLTIPKLQALVEAPPVRKSTTTATPTKKVAPVRRRVTAPTTGKA